MSLLAKHKNELVLITLLIIGVLFFAFVPAIPQDSTYHEFADANVYFGISNFWNVLSNLPFLIVGLIAYFSRKRFGKIDLGLQLFFISITLVSLGSAYYHFTPNDASLVWDRLPMTLAFMGLFSAVISEYYDDNLGKKLLWPLALTGLLSIIWWIYMDDLRVYILVQFVPMLAIPILLIFFNKAGTNNTPYWYLLGFYVLAKGAEHYDEEVYEVLHFISGHSLKHLFAAIGIYLFIIFKHD